MRQAGAGCGLQRAQNQTPGDSDEQKFKRYGDLGHGRDLALGFGGIGVSGWSPCARLLLELVADNHDTGAARATTARGTRATAATAEIGSPASASSCTSSPASARPS